MGYTITVPGRRKKWVTGALVRDQHGHELYRVTGAPRHYHEDCLADQKVSKVREVPEDWQRVVRLMGIMEQVRTSGMHTPASRGGYEQQPVPATNGAPVARWEARRDASSYASYPTIEARADVLVYCQPIYDDSPVVTWLRDAALADEVRALIATQPSLCKYPAVSVRKAVV